MNQKYMGKFRTISFVILLGTLAVDAVAQQNMGILKGRVLAADGSPAFVSVWLKKNHKTVMADSKGNFNFQHLSILSDTLIISSVNAQPYKQAVNMEASGITDLGEIKLNFNIAQLEDIEVKGRIAHSYKSDYSYLGTKTQTALIDVPQSISSITKELIEDKMELTLKDAISDAAGVNQYSGYDEFSIRGFRADNARMFNGLRGYNTTFTSPLLVNVERVEVIKGPSAVLYGNCDPGGTVNLVSKKPLPKKEGEINIGTGSWDHFRVLGDITGPLNNKKTLLYRINGGYDQTHLFRDQYYFKTYEIAPSFSYIPNERVQLNVDFSLSHTNTILDRGQPGFQDDISLHSTPINRICSQEGDYLHETKMVTSLLFSYKINSHINFNSGYLNFFSQQNVAEHGLHSFISNDSVNLYYSTWDYQSTTNTFTDYFTFRFHTGRISHQLLAGFDYVTSAVILNQQYYEAPNLFPDGSGIVGTFSLKHPQYFPRPIHDYELSDYESDASNVEPTQYNTSGAYVQEQLSVGKWELLLGLRQTWYSVGGDVADTSGDDQEKVLLPRIGLVYKLRPNTSIYATYNKGFDPFEASTSTQIFNSPFKPITSELFELGAKANFFHNKLSSSIAIYQLTLRNVAVNANDITNPNLFVQQGKTRSKGIELETSGNVLPNLSISLAYSYCLAKVLESTLTAQKGSIMENAPKHTSNSWVKYMFSKGSLKGFGLAIGHTQVSARNTLDPDIVLPGYFVLNAGVRYAHKHYTASLNLNNISNTTYWLGAYNNISKWPGSPRNFMLTVGYRF
jgi:iron complex outermembrane recepter protein